jgi:ABC-type glycerol-3-phosphate transport system permease component
MIKKVGGKVSEVLVLIMLLFLTFTFIFPLYYMIVNSLKTQSQYFMDRFGLPKGILHLDNYISMVNQFNICHYIYNTSFITVLSVVFVIIFSVFSAYAFAKLKFPGKSISYILIISTMFVPGQVTLIPIYVMFSNFGLINNPWSVILVYIAGSIPSTILLLTSNFRSIPTELLEASRIDGCNYFSSVRHVILPMGVPAIVISIIFVFITSWNDLFTPMILLQGTETQTLIVALTNIISRFTGDYPFQMAGLVFCALPVIVMYIFLQRYLVDGLMMGAIK